MVNVGELPGGFSFYLTRRKCRRENEYRKVWRALNQPQKASIERYTHQHTLRHTFTKELHREKGEDPAGSKAMRQADLSTTKVYTHIADEELEWAMRSFRGSAE